MPKEKLPNAHKKCVTILQEILIKKKVVPKYTLLSGDRPVPNGELYIFEVSVNDTSMRGSGRCKKEAKENAAKNLLRVIDLNAEEIIQVKNIPYEPEIHDLKENYVGKLTEYCGSKKLFLPTYNLTFNDGPPHLRNFYVSCSVSNFEVDAVGPSKKEARRQAAKKMFELLKSDGIKKESKEIKTVKERKCAKKCIQNEYMIENFTNCCISFKDVKIVNKSTTLQSLKDYTAESIDKLESPEEIIRNILLELKCEYRIKKIPLKDGENKYLVSFKINSWTPMAVGLNKEDALKNVCIKILKFLSCAVKNVCIENDNLYAAKSL